MPTEFPDCFNPLFNARIFNLIPMQKKKKIKLCHHSYQITENFLKAKLPHNATALYVWQQTKTLKQMCITITFKCKFEEARKSEWHLASK